jgi:hypothetical protein
MCGQGDPTLIDKARPLGVTALAGALLFAAACGGNGGTKAAAPKTSTSADPRAAFRQCLQQHGVTLPNDGRRGQSGRPSGPPTARPSNLPSMSDSQRQALQACASLAPNGGRFGNGVDQSALKAFQSCMSQHGVKITNSARPGVLRTATADPKAAAAFRTCRALLPQRPFGGRSATPNAAPAATPS